jgi:aminopeptidase N
MTAKINFLLLSFIGLTFFSSAQPPSRSEVLRGGLRPERECYDVIFYELIVEPNIDARSLAGTCQIHFIAKSDFESMQIDLFANMQIDSIVLNGRQVSWRRDFDAVFISTGEKLQNGTPGILTVSYHGKPLEARNAPWDGGFVWKKDAAGKPWVGVACQGTGASLWWPCKDHLSDEPDSMRISCVLPADLVCISNGKQLPPVSLQSGKTIYTWHVSYPINNYNVTLNIGDYAHINDHYISQDGDSLSLDYYVLKENYEKAKQHFKQVKPMLHCYEKFLGKYPFYRDGYALVETPYLGMEHQGAIAYGNNYKTGYAGMDRSGQQLPFDYIIIHETAHEWWGNSVSAADIADMWIHESFCTYSEAIYVECMHGYDTAMTYVNAMRSAVGNNKPIYGTFGLNREGHSDMYLKGMLFLNTLRHVIHDDSKWWPMIKNLSDTTFKMRITDYDEVVDFFSRETKQNLRPLFEQYVKHAQLPLLEYSLKPIRNGVCMKYRWNTQAVGFEMPIEMLDDKEIIRILPAKKWQSINLSAAPEFDDKRFYYRRKQIE